MGEYSYHRAQTRIENDKIIATPVTSSYSFKTERKVPKLGVMLIGLCGNNGSTVVGGVIANREDTYIPLKSLVPMVEMNDIVFGGWDINNMNLADAMARAKVFDYDLQRQLKPFMKDIVP